MSSALDITRDITRDLIHTWKYTRIKSFLDKVLKGAGISSAIWIDKTVRLHVVVVVSEWLAKNYPGEFDISTTDNAVVVMEIGKRPEDTTPLIIHKVT